MNLSAVTLEAVLKPDGTLELAERIPLPAGRVQVTIVPVPELPADDPFWKRMQARWAAQRARGHTPRSEQEVEEERRAVRDEWEERMRRIEQMQAEAAGAPGAGGMIVCLDADRTVYLVEQKPVWGLKVTPDSLCGRRRGPVLYRF